MPSVNLKISRVFQVMYVLFSTLVRFEIGGVFLFLRIPHLGLGNINERKKIFVSFSDYENIRENPKKWDLRFNYY